MNCPQCGSALPDHVWQTKLVQCDYCDSTLLVEANRISKQTLQSRTIERQSLLEKGGLFQWRDQRFRPQGFIQYEHTDGYLTDWWVTNEQADEQSTKQHTAFWLSEDDEHFFLTQEHACTAEADSAGLAWSTLQPNRELTLLNQKWLVTRKQVLRYTGMQGALPVTTFSPIRHLLYLAQPNATSLLLDCSETGDIIGCRKGSWLDPFEIERIP